MKTVLIVEDDSFFREAIKTLLIRNNYKILEAPDGKTAQDIVGATHPDAILSDIQMPNGNGVELLQWTQTNRPTPFILMTGFSHILETQKAQELGAHGFICKPFRDIELLGELNKIFPLSDSTEAKPHAPSFTDQDFCRVSLNEFVTTKQINFDIYVRLVANKFIKIGHKGSNIPIERIENYGKKGIKHLYIKREDFRELVQFNLALNKVIQKSDQVSREKKVNFIKYTGEVILEKAFVEGVDEEAFQDAKEFLQASADAVSEDQAYFTLLAHLNSHSDSLYAHSLCVSMYSLMIARKMGITASQTFFKLSMAGLFHDIGKKEIDPEVLNTPRINLTFQQRQLVETHPTRGKDILVEIKNVPSEVIRIVYEHHEDCLGQGYPQGLKKIEVHPLTLILATANVFAEYAIKGPGQLGMSGANAIQHMSMHYEGRLAREPLAALKKVFNIS